MHLKQTQTRHVLDSDYTRISGGSEEHSSEYCTVTHTHTQASMHESINTHSIQHNPAPWYRPHTGTLTLSLNTDTMAAIGVTSLHHTSPTT